MTKDFIKGKVEVKTFDNGGKILKVWIPKDELERVTKENGINIEIKFSKDSGKPYIENNTFQPQKTSQPKNWI